MLLITCIMYIYCMVCDQGEPCVAQWACAHCSGCLLCESHTILQAVVKAVLPKLDGLHLQVKSAMESTVESELRADAIKVHEALLVRPCHMPPVA